MDKKLQRLAELKYVGKLIEQEIDHLLRDIDIGELDRKVPVSFGAFQKVNKPSYNFHNEIVKEVIGNEIFSKIAKVSKTALSSVTTPDEWKEIEDREGVQVNPGYPYLKFIHVHYPDTKVSVKTGEKFHTVLKLG